MSPFKAFGTTVCLVAIAIACATPLQAEIKSASAIGDWMRIIHDTRYDTRQHILREYVLAGPPVAAKLREDTPGLVQVTPTLRLACLKDEKAGVDDFRAACKAP